MNITTRDVMELLGMPISYHKYVKRLPNWPKRAAYHHLTGFNYLRKDIDAFIQSTPNYKELTHNIINTIASDRRQGKKDNNLGPTNAIKAIDQKFNDAPIFARTKFQFKYTATNL